MAHRLIRDDRRPAGTGCWAMVLVAVVTLAIPPGVVLAAAPSSGTVSPPSTTLGFTGGPFDFTNQSGAPYVPPAPPVSLVCANPASPCDDFALTVSIPPSDSTIYFLTVNVHFTNPAKDFYLYLIDADGVTVDAISANTAGIQESFTYQVPTAATTSYTVRVVPFDVVTGAGGDTYSASG